jgi:hypothetical protein
MHDFFSFGPLGATLGAGFVLVALILVLWEIFWKGLALWHAAREGQWVWFVVFLVVHTAGILEIIYLIWFRDNRETTRLFPFGAAPAPVNAPTTIVEETVIITEAPSDESRAA